MHDKSYPYFCSMRFIISDGKIIEKSSYKLPEIHFGKGTNLCQKIWYGYGGIPLFPENLELLKRQAEVLGIPFPTEFKNQRELFRLVKRMLNKNRFYRSGHVLLQIFHDGSSVHSLVSSTTFTDFTFPYNEDGALAAFSSQKKYTPNTLNRWPFFNEKLWQAALAEIKDAAVQQVIIVNEKGSICECAYRNFFVIAGNKLKTPSYMSGCHENALRILVLEAASKLGLEINESNFVSEEDIYEADEIFCASESNEIQWIMGIEKQRYIHYFSVRIAEELNILLKSKALINPL